MKRFVFSLILPGVLLAFGCSDDSEAICKCGPGFVCDPQTNQCVAHDADWGVSPEGGMPADGGQRDGQPTSDTTGSTDSNLVKYFDTACPPQHVAALTQDKIITGTTSAQPVEGHCGIDEPYTAVGKVTVTEEKKVRLMATAASDVEIVLSLRTECTIDHGCFLGLASADYRKIVTAGTYNIFVATSKPADFTLNVEFLEPIPDSGED